MLQMLFSKFAFYSYWGMALVATVVVAVVVAMVSKSVHCKFFGVLAGVLVMLGFIAPIALRINEDKQVVEAKQDRYATAKAIFDERCKSAGEKIYKTVDNVDGVTLLKVRGDYSDAKGHDPMWEDAGLPNDYGEGYVVSFLGWSLRNTQTGLLQNPIDGSHRFPLSKVYGILKNGKSVSIIDEQPNLIDEKGYKFVDVKLNDTYIRYQLKPQKELEKSPLTATDSSETKKPAFFTIDYINYINPKDRAYWIAGTKVIIKDSRTNELLAEKTWYTLERGQGSTATDRTPWIQSNISCPIDGRSHSATADFVKNVLKPKQS